MDSILLVEDRAELREMLVQALTRVGYEATGAATLAEAESALARRRVNRARAEGEAMDLNQTEPFTHPTRIW